MRRLPLTTALSLAAILSATPLLAAPDQASPPPSAPSLQKDPVKPGKPAVKAYLSDDVLPDPLKILPPPPALHSPLDNADHAAFTSTRALQGSARWNLAANDVAEGAAAVLENFACVLGVRIDQARVPATLNLLERARLDLVHMTRIPKVHYRRLRPFVGNEAPICVQRSQALADSFSYPSGHATQGWAYALIMAALVPEKATAILADEPVASLDPVSARKVMETLRDLNRNDHLSVIVTLHHVEYAVKYCKRVVALKAGQIVYDGPTSGLSRQLLIDIYGPEIEDAGVDELGVPEGEPA